MRQNLLLSGVSVPLMSFNIGEELSTHGLQETFTQIYWTAAIILQSNQFYNERNNMGNQYNKH